MVCNTATVAPQYYFYQNGAVSPGLQRTLVDCMHAIVFSKNPTYCLE